MMNKSVSTELEKLVNMAEEVSETVISLHTKTANLRLMLMFSIVGLYAALGSTYFVFQRPSWFTDFPIAFYYTLILLSAFLGLGSLVYIYKYIKNIRLYRRSLYAETEILKRLLDMVHEYKENMHEKEMSYVEQAILDMKLQRIKYSNKW
jgi:hypothetical protein